MRAAFRLCVCVSVCVWVWVWVWVCVYVCVCVDLWVAGAEKIGSISAAGLMLALAAGFIGMVRYVFFGFGSKAPMEENGFCHCNRDS